MGRERKGKEIMPMGEDMHRGNDYIQVQSQSTLRMTANHEAVFADVNAEPHMKDGEEPTKSE